MKKQKLLGLRRKNGERGFTLLEYAAGAVVLLGGAYFAMDAFSDSLQAYFGSVSDWVTDQADNVDGLPRTAPADSTDGRGN